MGIGGYVGIGEDVGKTRVAVGVKVGGWTAGGAIEVREVSVHAAAMAVFCASVELVCAGVQAVNILKSNVTNSTFFMLCSFILLFNFLDSSTLCIFLQGDTVLNIFIPTPISYSTYIIPIDLTDFQDADSDSCQHLYKLRPTQVTIKPAKYGCKRIYFNPSKKSLSIFLPPLTRLNTR